MVADNTLLRTAGTQPRFSLPVSRATAGTLPPFQGGVTDALQTLARIGVGAGTLGLSEIARANLARQREQQEQTARQLALAAAGVGSEPLRPGQAGPPAPRLSPERQTFEIGRLRALGVPGAEEAFRNLLTGQISPEEQRAFGLQERGLGLQERGIRLREQEAAQKQADVKRREKIQNRLLSNLDQGVTQAQTGAQQQSKDEILRLQQANRQLRRGLLDPDLRVFAEAEMEANNAQIAEIRDFNKRRNTAKRTLTGALSKSDNVLATIDRALPLVTADAAGLGSLRAIIPGTGATDLESLVSTIQANIGFKELQAMRDASPTGGALGNVTEREISLLQSVIQNLETRQSPAQLRENLNIVRQKIQESMQRISVAYEQDFGVPLPGTAIPGKEGQILPATGNETRRRRVRFDAQGNRIQQ